MKDNKENGFTIVELMIATSVLSTLLILVTIVMIGIGNLYYKGINQARVQDAVRTISEDVGQHIQLSDKASSFGSATGVVNHPELKAFCIGSTRYTFATRTKVNDAPSGFAYKHVFWRDNELSSGCAPANLMANNPSTADSINSIAGENGTGVELAPDNSYITEFTISDNGDNSFNIGIGMAYGDVVGQTNGSGKDTHCNGQTGDQFCSTSYLSTFAVKRLN